MRVELAAPIAIDAEDLLDPPLARLVEADVDDDVDRPANPLVDGLHRRGTLRHRRHLRYPLERVARRCRVQGTDAAVVRVPRLDQVHRLAAPDFTDDDMAGV